MSSFPSAVTAFNDFLINTREARVSGPDDIINDLVLNTYAFASLARTSDGGLAIKSGREISDTAKLVDFSNSRTYTPGDTRNSTRGSTGRRVTMPWRFHETERPYTEADIDLNEGDQYTQFKNLEKSLMVDLKTDHLNFLESRLWQQPNASQMEDRSVKPGQMASIPMFITESGRRPPSWTTTVGGVDPTTVTRWQNPVSRYTPTDMDNPQTGLFAAFDEMLLKLDFEPPQGKGRDISKPTDWSKFMILTTLDGVNQFQALLRSGNDSTRAGPQDPSYATPQFKGIRIRRVAAMETALLDETGAVVGVSEGTYTSQPYPDGKPRYFVLNADFAKVFFHPAHIMRETDPISGGVTQRDTMSVFMESWCNLFFRSRLKGGGIIRPV